MREPAVSLRPTLGAESVRREPHSFTAEYAEDERGGMTIFILVLFTLIILTTGVALDLLRHESERAELQDALDRGVLAAASLTQTQAARDTVQSYIDQKNYVKAPVDVRVFAQSRRNYRRVEASARYDMDTTFLRLAGLGTLPIQAGATAVEGRNEIEVSLVLDISGSMARERAGGTTQSRLGVLRQAASSFIDQILNEDNREHTSVSLIPYSGQVNAGPLFEYFSAGRSHYNSSCIEFEDADFEFPGFPDADSRGQVPHFQWFTFEGDRGYEADWGWCPSDSKALMPLSNNAGLLKARINQFRGHDGTGSNVGLKWALALLDPASQDVVADLVSRGVVDEAFEDRPTNWDANRVLKTIVLMTDGRTRYQQRPGPYGGWVLDTSSERNADELKQRQQFKALCDMAKEQDVVIFTIGFDVATGSTEYQDMRDCATTQAHFFHVQGLDLETAFRQIAATIQKLKLIG